MELRDIIVTLRLRGDQVNIVLAKLGLCPYNEVADLINTIRDQGDMAVQRAQMPSQPPMPTGNGAADVEPPPLA